MLHICYISFDSDSRPQISRQLRSMRSMRWRGFIRSSDPALAIPGRGKKPDYPPDCPAALPRITIVRGKHGNRQTRRACHYSDLRLCTDSNKVFQHTWAKTWVDLPACWQTCWRSIPWRAKSENAANMRRCTQEKLARCL
jgi:hypothetical protein